ncbi:MAG: hypothetical protein PF961_10495 [Planctomycetota bacterium]|nr:hypothetical protein [Planctomycetota bacterium]
MAFVALMGIICLSVTSAHAADATTLSPDEQAALRAIVDRVNAAAKAHTGDGMPTLSAVMREGDTSGAGMPSGPEADAIREQLAALTALMGVEGDPVQGAVNAVGGVEMPRDPSSADSFEIGNEGLLWVFWAADGPDMVLLPAQLATVAHSFPELPIRDNHVMRLSDWQDMLRTLSQIKDLLEMRDDAIPDAAEIAQKRELRDSLMKPYLAATTMAEARQTGGILILENAGPAVDWQITELPSFVFVSPRGVVHRRAGLHRDRTLASWIAGCLEWEVANDAALRERQRLLDRASTEDQ